MSRYISARNGSDATNVQAEYFEPRPRPARKRQVKKKEHHGMYLNDRRCNTRPPAHATQSPAQPGRQPAIHLRVGPAARSAQNAVELRAEPLPVRDQKKNKRGSAMRAIRRRRRRRRRSGPRATRSPRPTFISPGTAGRRRSRRCHRSRPAPRSPPAARSPAR